MIRLIKSFCFIYTKKKSKIYASNNSFAQISKKIFIIINEKAQTIIFINSNFTRLKNYFSVCF